MSSPVQAVILAGGSGSRLWPASRQLHPKQFLRVHGDQSLIESTIGRLHPLMQKDNVLIISGEMHAHGSAYPLSREYSMIMEPAPRNTAPAVALAALRGVLYEDDPVQIVLPADHVIKDEVKFRELIEGAVPVARDGGLVTFGIQPGAPATGFGYIKARGKTEEGVPVRVDNFFEKPDRKTALQYLTSGDYFWNAGIFVWRASSILREIALHLPAAHQVLECIRKAAREGTDFQAAVDAHFCDMPCISVDYGILEKSDNVYVIPSDIGWNDVGSWEAVYSIADKDASGNATHGRTMLRDCQNSLIEADSRLVAGIGIENMCVVETADAVLVCPLNRSQDVKPLVDAMKTEGFPEVERHRTVRRPWGEYAVLLESDFYKIKQIVVNPGEQLSLQKHHHRSEHWVVVSGVAEVQRGDEWIEVHRNESTFIPQGVKHRVRNAGKLPLKMIEVQSGEYVGEDDIERFDDEYGRKES